MKTIDLSALRKLLPPIIPRKRFEHYLGGILSQQYMANLDSRGDGPPNVKIGRSVCYLRDPLVDWLEARIQPEVE